jgi:hypothetical protein
VRTEATLEVFGVKVVRALGIVREVADHPGALACVGRSMNGLPRLKIKTYFKKRLTTHQLQWLFSWCTQEAKESQPSFIKSDFLHF